MEDTTTIAPPSKPEPRKRAPGAGVKALDGVIDVTRYQVMLDETTVALMRHIGEKNLSLGIREAARRVKEAKDTRAFSPNRHATRLKKTG